ncbi:MAG: hypothetical protein QM790_01605 [Nibricoccus sp.]
MTNQLVVGGKTAREIYLERGLVHSLFYDQAPTDLFRFSETGGRFGHRHQMWPVLEEYPISETRTRSADVDRRKINGIPYIFPGFRKGLSLSDGPIDFGKSGDNYVVPVNSPVPGGLVLSKDKANRISGHTHYSLMPAQVMQEEHFLFLLRRFASFAVPFALWKVWYPDRAAKFDKIAQS